MTKSDETVQLELQIESRDEATVNQVSAALQSVDVKRWPAARMDPVTVLAIAAGTVKLISALMDLKAKLATQKNAPNVKVSNATGTVLNLATATQSLLEDFLKASR
jgi:flagellar basal body P-ring protein FlgI